MILDTLAAAGVQDVVISPGSRSTPLAVVADAHPDLRTSILVDERSAGFFALGIAKASQKPVALICTSGTAGAHYYPAIIEAQLTHVPLIALTADRPGAVRGLGAAQTIDQIHLYGTRCAHFLDLPMPRASERALRSASGQVTLAALASVDGPVHINVPFDVGADGALITLPPQGRQTWQLSWLTKTLKAAHAVPDASSLAELVARCTQATRPLIIAGPDAGSADTLLALARVLDAPLVADVASGVRAQNGAGYIITHADAFTRHPEWPDADLLLRFGAWPTGKGVQTCLSRSQAHQVLFQDTRQRRDPEALAHTVVTGPVEAVVPALTQALQGVTRQGSNGWRARWCLAEQHVTRCLHETPDAMPEEAAAVRAALSGTNEPMGVVWASSLPIRHGETYGGSATAQLQSLAFRGANGIDGLLSAAAGVALGSARLVLLVVGDIAFLHDCGGLNAIARSPFPIVILLLNNGGGGIFDQLPIANAVPGYERLFATPQAVNFGLLTQAFGLTHHRVTTPDAVADVMRTMRADARLGHQVIEMCTKRAQTARAHKAWLQMIVDTLPREVLV